MRAPVRAAAYLGGALSDGNEAQGGEAFPVCVDPEGFGSKPDGAQVARVSNRILAHRCEATALELARAISEGKTILPAAFEGGRNKDGWRAQRLFLVDMDNDGEQKKRGYQPLGEWGAVLRAYAYGLPIVMSYQTFSGAGFGDDAERQRFRLVFAAPETFTDKERARAFAAGLLAAYPEADRRGAELERMFYGTDKEVSIWA